MTKFKPGDKVLVHMQDWYSKEPIVDRWGVIGEYSEHISGISGNFPHRVIFDGKEDAESFSENELQLLEDE